MDITIPDPSRPNDRHGINCILDISATREIEPLAFLFTCLVEVAPRVETPQTQEMGLGESGAGRGWRWRCRLKGAWEAALMVRSPSRSKVEVIGYSREFLI